MEKIRKTPAETAEILIEIYEAAFKGKERGRYLIEKVEVRQISGRDILKKSVASKIISEIGLLGYGMFVIEDYFAIVKNSRVLKWRKAPSWIVSQYTEDGLEEDYDEEDYDESDDDSLSL